MYLSSLRQSWDLVLPCVPSSPESSVSLLGSTAIGGCKAFSRSPQPVQSCSGLASSGCFTSQMKHAGDAVLLHISSKSGPVCISQTCNEVKLLKIFLSFSKKICKYWMAFQVFYSYLIVGWTVLLFRFSVSYLACFLRSWLLAAFTPDWWCCCFNRVLADVASRRISQIKLHVSEVHS